MLIFNKWPELDNGPIQKKDFLNYLKILCIRNLVPKNRKVLLQGICIPALQNFDGEVNNENTDLYNRVKNYGFELWQIEEVLDKYYQELASPVNTKKTAAFMGLSDRYVRYLAQKGVPCLDAKRHPLGWRIDLVSAADWLIRNHKVILT